MQHQCVHDDSYHIYTDGSKSNQTVGCSAIMGDTEYSAKLNNFVSSYSAELLAILLILKNILYRLNFNNFTVFSDSKSALSALNSFYSDNPIILDIHYFLNRLILNGKRISFCWSPGHVGIQGNEDADKAAKLAAAKDVIDFNLVSFKDTKFYIKCFIKNRFQEIWNAITTNTKLKEIKENISPWPTIPSKNRRDVRVLNRLRIGHTHLTHNFLLQTPHQMPVCDFCNEISTVKHILQDCPEIEVNRVRWNIPDSLKDILGENVNLMNICSFLKDINLYFRL